MCEAQPCVDGPWCAVIYTEAGDPKNTFCRSDSTDVLSTTPWIRVPYPGQWGRPTFRSFLKLRA